MTLAAVCTELSGEDAIELQTLDAAPLGPAAVRLAVRAASVNFPDVLVIANTYQMSAPLPFVRARTASTSPPSAFTTWFAPQSLASASGFSARSTMRH